MYNRGEWKKLFPREFKQEFKYKERQTKQAIGENSEECEVCPEYVKEGDVLFVCVFSSTYEVYYYGLWTPVYCVYYSYVSYADMKSVLESS